MEQLMIHYGVDWIAIALSLLGVYMLGIKQRYGFIIFAISNAIWLFLGLMWMDSIGMAVGNIIFLFINIKGFINWSKDEQAESTTA